MNTFADGLSAGTGDIARRNAVTETATTADLRLLQLVSSTLPVGAYTYSQGLEWAVEKGWVNSREALGSWLMDLLQSGMTHLEVPVFLRICAAMRDNDSARVAWWTATLLAHRETAELRTEESQRGRAMARLLTELEVAGMSVYRDSLDRSQLTGFALAVHAWEIDQDRAISAYLWSWLENAILAGVKLIPLGQSAGQRLLLQLSAQIPPAVAAGRQLADEQIGSSCIAQAIASSRHESQYTRLYRS